MGSVVPLKKSANSAYLELKNLLNKKLDKVESLIETKLKSDVNLIEKMSGHHLKSGGKRLRALLTLGSAKLSGYELGSREIGLFSGAEPLTCKWLDDYIKICKDIGYKDSKLLNPKNFQKIGSLSSYIFYLNEF